MDYVEDSAIIDLLETLDEILQEEHDVEIAASAAAIRALLAENVELEAMVDKLEAEVVKAREEGRRAGLEEAKRVIIELEDDYGEFAAIVALDRAQRNIGALLSLTKVAKVFAQTSTNEGEE